VNRQTKGFNFRRLGSRDNSKGEVRRTRGSPGQLYLTYVFRNATNSGPPTSQVISFKFLLSHGVSSRSG
jgi:hypothetical protein